MLPSESRKKLIDSLFQRAYDSHSTGAEFCCANYDNALQCANYLKFVFSGKRFKIEHKNDLYYIVVSH